MFLHYLTLHKTETRHWRAEAEAHWHLGPYSSGHHRRSQWQTWLHACVKAQGRHFEHLLWFSSEPLQTHRNPFLSDRLTLLRGRQHGCPVFV